MDGKITSVEYQELKANNDISIVQKQTSELDDNLESQSVPFKSYLTNDINPLGGHSRVLSKCGRKNKEKVA